MAINTSGQELAPGYLFMTPASVVPTPATRQNTGFMMTDNNDLVYGLGLDQATDFRVQEVNGTKYLTYWRGPQPNGPMVSHGHGNITFLGSEYNTAFVVCAFLNLNTGINPPPPCQLDVHEAQVTSRGTILATAYNNTPTDLSAVGEFRANSQEIF